MFDLDVLIICNDKDKYERFAPFVKKHMLSPESYQIFEDVGVWFTSHEDKIDWRGFKTWFKFIKHPSYKDEKHKLYDLIFDKLTTHIVNKDLEEELTGTLIARDYATKIADKSLSVAEGSETDTIQDVIVLVKELESELGNSTDTDKLLVTDDIHELIAATSSKAGISWRITQLNDAIGNIRKGKFIVVGSRPDSGKTSFLASESTYFLPQIKEDECILWFNNEEAGTDVKHRVIQSGIGWNSEQIELDPLGAKAEFEKQCGPLNKFKIVESSSMTIHTMEQDIKRHNPGVIIFDQLWKVHGFAKESGNEVMRQTMLFNWGREIAKLYAPVITVHQAGGGAGGERWIPMEMLYGSQTGIQGEADAIITIGRTYDPADDGVRFFYIPKNKMRGNLPMYRNGKFILDFDPDVGRFTSDGSFNIT